MDTLFCMTDSVKVDFVDVYIRFRCRVLEFQKSSVCRLSARRYTGLALRRILLGGVTAYGIANGNRVCCCLLFNSDSNYLLIFDRSPVWHLEYLCFR